MSYFLTKSSITISLTAPLPQTAPTPNRYLLEVFKWRSFTIGTFTTESKASESPMSVSLKTFTLKDTSVVVGLDQVTVQVLSSPGPSQSYPMVDFMTEGHLTNGFGSGFGGVGGFSQLPSDKTSRKCKANNWKYLNSVKFLFFILVIILFHTKVIPATPLFQ